MVAVSFAGGWLTELAAQRGATNPSGPTFHQPGLLDKMASTKPSVPTSTPPVPIGRAKPDYPFELRRDGITGEAIVEFIVNKEGKVSSAHVVRTTHPGFVAPAVEAVLNWKFKPGTKNGRKVATRMQVPIVFALSDPPGRPARETLQTMTTRQPGRNDAGAVYPYDALIENRQETLECSALMSSSGKLINVSWKGKPSAEFQGALEAMLEATRFQPALENGQPVARASDFKWTFNPFDGDVRISDEAAAIVKRLRIGGEGARFPSTRELDEKIRPIEQKTPVFPTRVGGLVEGGDAIIEFFIDGSGQVQLPRIVTASEPAFGYAACQAIATWRFTPPRIDGKPVVTRLRVPVQFKRQ